VPYLLTDLGADLRTGSIDHLTIDQKTEDAIEALAVDLPNLPAQPEPVIVEDSSGQHYLILEGNKRASAVAFVTAAALPRACDAYVGRSALTWAQLLAAFRMNPPTVS